MKGLTHGRWSRWLALAVTLAVSGAGARAQELVPRGPHEALDPVLDAIASRSPALETANVVLITVDALAPRVIGCYGAPKKNATPAIDAFADRSLKFTQAFAATPDRMPGIAAVVHSIYPSTLAALGGNRMLPSIGTIFADAGFDIRAAIDRDVAAGAADVDFDAAFGFGNRFSRIRTPRSYSDSLSRLIKLRQRDQFFFWAHFALPYPPADYHPGFTAKSTEAHYDAAVRCTDQAIGWLLETLAEQGVADDTIVVLTASSGMRAPVERPELLDRDLHDDVLHVPLLIHVPGFAAAVNATPVSTADVLPTVLSLLRLRTPWSIQGRSLAGLLLDEFASAPYWSDRAAYSERSPTPEESDATAAESIRTTDWRLVRLNAGAVAVAPVHDGFQVDAAESPNPATTRELLERLEKTAAYVAACSTAWAAGRFEAPAIRGPVADLARGRWLVARRDPRAAEFLGRILDESRSIAAEVLEILFDVDLPDDFRPRLERLTKTADVEARALAAALLVLRFDDAAALDVVLEGLGATTSDTRLRRLIEAVGEAGDEHALTALRKIDVAKRSRRLRASLDLAMTRLGDENARARLHRHLLDPAADYDKRELIDAYVELEPERAPGILELCLTDGDQRPATLICALDRLDRLGGARDPESVARLIAHPSQRVRERAADSLASRHQLAGAPALIALAASEDIAAAWASHRLIRDHAALTGSDLLPGVLLDAWAAGRAESLKTRDGAPVIGWPGIRFTLDAPARTATHFAFDLQLAGGREWPNDRATSIRLFINDARVTNSRTRFERVGDTWICHGTLPAGALEVGLNRVRMDFATSKHRDLAPRVSTLILLDPSGASRSFRPLAAVDTSPRATAPWPEAHFRFGRDDGAIVLRYTAWPVAETAGERFVEIAAGNATLARIAVPATGGVGEQRLDLPPDPWRTPNATLRIVGADGGKPSVAPSGVLAALIDSGPPALVR